METQPPPPERSKAMSWFLGCLIALVVFAVLCAGGSWLACGRLVDMGIDWTHDRMVEAVEESNLPEEQVSSLVADLGRLRDAAIDGRVDWNRLEELEQEVERMVSLGVLQFFEGTVIDDCGMEADEAAAAKRIAQRYSRGVQEGTLDLQNLDIRHEGGQESWDIEEVRDTIARMQRKVDAAQIPDEPFQADVAGEFSALVDDLILDEKP